MTSWYVLPQSTLFRTLVRVERRARLTDSSLVNGMDARVLRHGRDVHPTWVKSSIETLSNTRVWGFCSTRGKSEEDFDSY